MGTSASAASSVVVPDLARAASADAKTVSAFFAKGMLMNVLSSMHLMEPTEPWAKRLLDGCQEK